MTQKRKVFVYRCNTEDMASRSYEDIIEKEGDFPFYKYDLLFTDAMALNETSDDFARRSPEEGEIHSYGDGFAVYEADLTKGDVFVIYDEDADTPYEMYFVEEYGKAKPIRRRDVNGLHDIKAYLKVRFNRPVSLSEDGVAPDMFVFETNGKKIWFDARLVGRMPDEKDPSLVLFELQEPDFEAHDMAYVTKSDLGSITRIYDFSVDYYDEAEPLSIRRIEEGWFTYYDDDEKGDGLTDIDQKVLIRYGMITDCVEADLASWGSSYPMGIIFYSLGRDRVLSEYCEDTDDFLEYIDKYSDAIDINTSLVFKLDSQELENCADAVQKIKAKFEECKRKEAI